MHLSKSVNAFAGIGKPIPDINTDINTTTSVVDEQVKEIYNFYLEVFNKSEAKYKLSPARIDKIKSRLKDAGKEVLMIAIEKTSKSPFHNGKNDRKWKADLDFIIRNYEQVERLSNLDLGNTYLKTAPKKKVSPPAKAIEKERVVSTEDAEKNKIILQLVRAKKATFDEHKMLKSKSIATLREMLHSV